MARSYQMLGIVTLIVLLLAACVTQPAATPPAPTPAQAATQPAPATTPAPAQAEVTIKGFAFDPGELTVTVGTTVTWTNDGSTTHTITADDGTWDSGRVSQGDTFSRVFDQPGTFTYHCAIHTSMTGTIIVTE